MHHLLFPLQHFVEAVDIFIGEFEVEHALQIVAVGSFELGDGTRADGKDGMQLLHHEDVVKPFRSRQAEADVFKIADGILLSVQIIRLIACIHDRNVRIFHTLSRLTARSGIDIGAFTQNLRGCFDTERMHGDVVGTQRENAVDRFGKRQI